MRRWLTLTSVFLLTILLLALVSAQAQTPIPCPNGLPPRLSIGGAGRVIPGNTNNVRASPSRTGRLIGRLNGGDTFSVLDGPLCADGFTWWRVRADKDTALVGWVVEGGANAYALEPLGAPGVATAIFAGTVDYQGVSLVIDPSIAGGAAAAFVPAADTLGDPVPLPDHLRFTLLDPRGGSYGHVLVTPAQAYNLLPGCAGCVDVFARLLGERPQWRTPFPSGLVQDGAPRVLFAQAAYVDFQDGSGFRYVHQSAPDAAAPSGELRYVMVGLTGDGTYFVQVYVHVSYLQALPAAPPAGATAQQVDDYLARLNAQVQGAAPSDFVPALNLLDALAASLRVGRPAVLDAAVSAAQGQAATLAPQLTATAAAYQSTLTAQTAATARAEAACGTFAARLTVGGQAQQALQRDPLRVRSSANGQRTGVEIRPGTLVNVIGGPECVGGTRWWQVSALDGAWTGWVAEAGNDRYYLAPVLTGTPTVTACGTFAARLTLGAPARQTLQRDPLRLRDAPDGAPSGVDVRPGDVVTVIAGPTCLNGTNWWQVITADGSSGWVAEAGGDQYYLAPVAP